MRPVRSGASLLPERLADAADLAAAVAAVAELEQELADSGRLVERLREDMMRAKEEMGRLQESFTLRENELRAENAACQRALETQIVELAFAVAKRAVGRELAVAPTLVVEWAHEAIAMAELGEGTTLSVSPDVMNSIPAETWRKLGVRVEVDDGLPPGSCEARRGSHAIDISAAGRIGALADHLGVRAESEAL